MPKALIRNALNKNVLMTFFPTKKIKGKNTDIRLLPKHICAYKNIVFVIKSSIPLVLKLPRKIDLAIKPIWSSKKRHKKMRWKLIEFSSFMSFDYIG